MSTIKNNMGFCCAPPYRYANLQWALRGGEGGTLPPKNGLPINQNVNLEKKKSIPPVLGGGCGANYGRTSP